MHRVPGLAVLFFVSAIGPAFSQARGGFPPVTSIMPGRGERCSLESMTGTYSFSGQGTVFAGTNHAVEGDAGTMTFDGRGNFTGQGSFGLNGAAIQTRLVGTYTVNSDCTATALFTDDAGELIHERGVVLDNGRETRFTETDPGVEISRVSRRIDDQGTCATNCVAHDNQ